MFHLDHLAMGAADLDATVRRLRAETGLGLYDGGASPSTGLAVWIMPLGGDVYLEIESPTRPADSAESGPGPGWFRRATADGQDRWMFWCLRTDTRDELAEVAQRLGSSVGTYLGRTEVDGTQRVITSAPHISQVWETCWRHGLPNWYYRAPGIRHPAHGEVTGDRVAAGVAWLEVGADEAELRKHIGEDIVDRLNIRTVSGVPGLRAVAVRTTDGAEVVIRRAPADPRSF